MIFDEARRCPPVVFRIAIFLAAPPDRLAAFLQREIHRGFEEVTMYQFYQRYFSATKNVSWLARQATAQRFEVLNFLMQWDVTQPTSDH